MKKILIAMFMVLALATSSFAGGPPHDPPGQTETYTQTQNVFGGGAASLSGSGVAGWGCSMAYSNNTGFATAFGSSAFSTNTSKGWAMGNAGFAAAGLSGAGSFYYTNKITITQPKQNGPK